MTIVTYIGDHIFEVLVVMIGALYGFGTLRNKKDIDDLNDNSRWETALNIRNVEITDLKAQLLDQRKRYDATVVSLQSQITALQLQVKDMMEKNEVLANTVSGRDLLIEVIADQKKIAESLIKFEVLLGTEGILHQFINNDNKMLSDLEDIKKTLSIGKRHSDKKTK